MPLIGLNREFKREYPYVEQVKKCSFFNKGLKEKVKEGEIFCAIREKNLDFYYRGQRAVRRSALTYRTNQYYLDGIQRKGSPEKSFQSGNDNVILDNILDNCNKKAETQPESFQIAKLYKKFSYLSDFSDKNKPLLFDVEARFSSLSINNKGYNSDKIDLVFYMPGSALMFVEVKRRRDQRIRAKENKAEVCEQVTRYKEQISERNKEILIAYGNVVDTMSKIWGDIIKET